MEEYLKLVLVGYLNNEPKYLTKYFKREQKKAEEFFIDSDEFYEKCFDIIKLFEEILDTEINKRKKELYFMLDGAKNKTANYGESESISHLTYDEKCDLFIDNCTKELEVISRDNFTVHLHSLTKGEFSGHLWNNDVIYIKKCLIYAKNEQNEIIKSVKKNSENLAWFNVGVLFANGEMNQLKIDFNSNATKIAKFKFGEKWKKYRPYISESINNTTNSDKNIFSNNTKLQEIKEHCLLNKITITPDFTNKIKPT